MAKRKKSVAKPIALTLVILIGLSIGIFYFSKQFYKPSFVHYPGYGIDMPVNYGIHGIDVSRHQSNISWKLVREMKEQNIGLNFAFIKATEGLGSVDEQFRRNWLSANKSGMIRGAYHFFIPTKSAKLQAKNFAQIVQLKKGDLPPVLDVEQAYGASITEVQMGVFEWLLLIEKKYGVKPIIYTNVDFYNIYLAGKFDHYPLWVAHYLVKDKPRIARSWSFWQHSERGRVNGIERYVDFNVFNGDSLAFEKIRIQ